MWEISIYSIWEKVVYLRKTRTIMNKIKHNLSESYLLSLTEQQRIYEMSQWSSSEWQQYYCPNGTMSLEEFSKLGHQIIDEEYERLGWK